jgi:hypothetical protein
MAMLEETLVSLKATYCVSLNTSQTLRCVQISNHKTPGSFTGSLFYSPLNDVPRLPSSRSTHPMQRGGQCPPVSPKKPTVVNIAEQTSRRSAHIAGGCDLQQSSLLGNYREGASEARTKGALGSKTLAWPGPSSFDGLRQTRTLKCDVEMKRTGKKRAGSPFSSRWVRFATDRYLYDVLGLNGQREALSGFGCW